MEDSRDKDLNPFFTLHCTALNTIMNFSKVQYKKVVKC